MLSLHNMHLSGIGDAFAVSGNLSQFGDEISTEPAGRLATPDCRAGQGAGDSISCGVIVKPGIVDGVFFDGNIRSR